MKKSAEKKGAMSDKEHRYRLVVSILLGLVAFVGLFFPVPWPLNK